MFDIVFIKGIVVGQAICELDIDGQIACLHQFQVHQQSAGAAIAVTERMDIDKIEMRRKAANQGTFSVGIQERK